MVFALVYDWRWLQLIFADPAEQLNEEISMIRTCGWMTVVTLVFIGVCSGQTKTELTSVDDWTAEKLLDAAQQERVDDVRAAIEAGVDVNSKTAYGATALFFACDRGNADLVKILIDAGADPNVQDTFYNSTPITWAQQKQHKDIVVMLLAKGGKGADRFLASAIATSDFEFAKKIIESKAASEPALIKARDAARKKGDDEKIQELLELLETLDLPQPDPVEKMTPEMLQRYVGKYKSQSFVIDVELDDDQLKLGFNGASKANLEPSGTDEFLLGTSGVKFEMDGDQVKQLVLSFGGSNVVALPVKPSEMKVAEPSKNREPAESEDAPEEPKFGPSSESSLAADLAISSKNWPSFRGAGGRGVAEGQNPPIAWNVSEQASENINFKWKTPIPGLGLSCPSIWGDRIYLTSAVSEQATEGLKIGLYGNVDSVEEDYEFDFNVYCLEKNSGSVVWERTATTARPKVKRHTKSSHANPTIATDGNYVVAFFGSEGIYCYDVDGELKWKKDLGFLDSGWFYDPGYQWGFGSSPIIFENRVYVQCDIQKNSFVAAYDLATGEEVWRTAREEIPSWSTPTIHEFGDTAMLLTHATKAARGYDARTGDLLWTLPKHSEIVVPTPFVAHDLIFIASGYSPIQPIYAIRPTARGDISLPEGTDTNEFIAWSTQRNGPYMPSPIAYGDYLYCCGNSGIMTCYDAKSGAQVYKKRIKADGGSLSFTASPLAADGHLYLTAEDGRVLVVKAGPEYELVETNQCGESILATPAISDGAIYLRTQNSLIAVGD